MAMSEETINFNYNQAIAKADELDAQADKLQVDGAGELDGIVSVLNRGWTGDNADAYILKCNGLLESIEDIISAMRAIASAIRTMAKEIYDAEMRALAIARAEAEARERERREREERERRQTL